MRNSRIVAPVLTLVLGALPAGRLAAQSGAERPLWETLMQAPLPEDCQPIISVFSISGPPAPPVQGPIGAGHKHAGPVFVYILQGEIETQIEPDPPAIYKPGDFFYEAPMHVHRFQRNLSKTEPGRVVVFQAGNTGQANPAVKLLLQEPLQTTANRELSLLRLTLPAGTMSEGSGQSGPGMVYVLEGKIEAAGRTYSAGDLFLKPANAAGLAFKNANRSDPARLLLYQVSEQKISIPLPAAAQTLPHGEGRPTYEAICGGCHGADIVLGSQGSRARWEATVDEMRNRGASGSEAEFKTITDYLATYFGLPVNVNTATPVVEVLKKVD
jgi:quercetin dioxygenase-like cupin family protein